MLTSLNFNVAYCVVRFIGNEPFEFVCDAGKLLYSLGLVASVAFLLSQELIVQLLLLLALPLLLLLLIVLLRLLLLVPLIKFKFVFDVDVHNGAKSA